MRVSAAGSRNITSVRPFYTPRALSVSFKRAQRLRRRLQVAHGHQLADGWHAIASHEFGAHAERKSCHAPEC